MRGVWGVCLTVLLALGGCTLGPDYVRASQDALATGGTYAAPRSARETAGGTAGKTGDLTSWWTRFDDPVLTRLVEDTEAGNLDLASAASRVRQARAALIQARSARLPTIGASAGISRNGFLTGAPSTTIPIITNPGGIGGGGTGGTGGGTVLPGIGTRILTQSGQTNLSLGGDASYTVDLFGGVRRGIEAARGDLAASAYDAEATRIAVVSETATNYIQGRIAQERLAIARDSLRIADDNLEIAGWRVKAGLVSATDEEQARTQAEQRRATIPPLIQTIAQASNRLGVLSGRAPAALAGVFDPPAPVPVPPADIAVGVPADTLRQRPDVLAAEERLAAASARIGVAEAQLYPALRLTGSIADNAGGFGSLFDTVTFGLFGGLTQTLFDGGRLRAQVEGQRAATEGAFADYRRTILTALEDVENALRALTSAKERMTAQAAAVKAAEATAIYARSNYRAGLTDFTTLLTIENQLLSARDGLASARGDRALASVQLFNALGGGFSGGGFSGGGFAGGGFANDGSAATPPPTAPTETTTR